MRLDDLVEPGVVLIDRLPDLDHRDAAVFHDGVVSNEAIGFLLRRHRSRGDLVVHVGGHAGGVMLLENRHRTSSVRVMSWKSRLRHARHSRLRERAVTAYRTADQATGAQVKRAYGAGRSMVK